MKAHGGLITMADLAAYKAVERTPLTGRYRNYTVIAAPPPSSGGVGLLQMLGMLEGQRLREEPGPARRRQSTTWPKSCAASTRTASAPRRPGLRGEPGRQPARHGVSSRRGERPSIRCRRRRARPSAPGWPPTPESAETTHFNVVDAEGNAVAVTYTLNGGFGNGITVPGLGFLLNNEMDDFTTKPGEAEPVRPRAGRAEHDCARQASAVVDDADHRAQGRSAPHAARRTRRIAHPHRGAAGLSRHRRLRDEPAGGRRCAAVPPSVAAGCRSASSAASRRTRSPLLRSRGHEVRQDTGPVSAVVEVIVKDGGWLQGAADARRFGRASGY